MEWKRPDIETIRRLREGIQYHGLGETSVTDKPLQPLTEGIVLIVGVKTSNLNEELRNHPRVVIWDSQQEHWTSKDLPANTRAVFMTRFISHNAYDHVISQVRKRKLTVFNPEGTGLIAKQVKELLNLNPSVVKPDESVPAVVVNATPSGETMGKKLGSRNKMKPLIQFIDFTGNTRIVDNAEILWQKAQELGIETTKASLCQFISKQRKLMSGASGRASKPNAVVISRKSLGTKLDVSVQMLDNAIHELQDIRDYLVATVEENAVLKARIEKFKSFLSGE